MDIINAKLKHLNEVYDLICELEGEKMCKESFSTTYKTNLDTPNVFYRLVIDNEEVVGFASLHIQSLLHHGNRIGELQEIIIKHEKQGCGFGTLLFDDIKQKAEENGCIQLEVCCNQNRKASHMFYEKQCMNNSHYKFTIKML